MSVATASPVGPVDFHVLVGLDPRTRTETLLARYRAVLDEGRTQRRFGNALWLVPAREAVRPVVDRLLEEGPEAVFSPRVMTFDGFAESILEALAAHITPVSPALQRSLLREIANRLVREGRLRHFQPIAGTSGFLDLVESFIADLKRDEIWPEVFLERLVEAGLAGPRDRELVDVYEAYQSALLRGSLFDNEGRFWSARQALSMHGWDFLGRLDLVVVDGFSDFTATQIDLLTDFARHARETWVSLPLPAEAADANTAGEIDRVDGLRGDLFGIPTETLARLRSRGEVRVETAGGTHPVRAIDHVARHLFGDFRGTPASKDCAGVEVHAVAGAAAELKTCVVGVKRWLLEGVSPSEIVVVSRDSDASERLMKHFADAGVPTVVPASRTLARSPRIKLLLALLRLETEDWRFERLSGVLNSSLFRPQWPEWVPDESPRQATRFLREEQLPGALAPSCGPPNDCCRSKRGRSYPCRFGRSVGEGSREMVSSSDRSRPAREPRPGAAGSARRPDISRMAGSPGSIRAGVRPRTVRRGALVPRRGNTYRRRRLGPVRADALFVVAGRAAVVGWDSLLSLGEFLSRLVDLLDREPGGQAAHSPGIVRVLTPNQARHVDARRVWICGLSEKSFPGAGTRIACSPTATGNTSIGLACRCDRANTGCARKCCCSGRWCCVPESVLCWGTR